MVFRSAETARVPDYFLSSKRKRLSDTGSLRRIKAEALRIHPVSHNRYGAVRAEQPFARGPRAGEAKVRTRQKTLSVTPMQENMQRMNQSAPAVKMRSVAVTDDFCFCILSGIDVAQQLLAELV